MAILDSAAIMPRTCVAADQVLVLDTVGSTNTYAADLVRAGRLFGMDGMDGIAGNLVWSGREIVVVAANEQDGRSRAARPYVGQCAGGVIHRVAGGERAGCDCARFVRQWLAADDCRLRDA